MVESSSHVHLRCVLDFLVKVMVEVGLCTGVDASQGLNVDASQGLNGCDSHPGTDVGVCLLGLFLAQFSTPILGVHLVLGHNKGFWFCHEQVLEAQINV